MDAEGSPGNDRLKSRSAITTLVNGPRLQILRQQAGLTQEQLAEKSGYSDRLIRKAEASGPLRKATIAHLADALNGPGCKVTADDLTFSHEALAIEVHMLLLNGSTGLRREKSTSVVRPKQNRRSARQQPLASETLLGDVAHAKLSLHVAGEELGIPFAGTYCGLSFCHQFRERFLESFGSVLLHVDQTRSFTSDGEVCVHAVTDLIPPVSTAVSVPPAKVWWFLKVKFETNLITRLELMYDTGTICHLLGRFPT